MSESGVDRWKELRERIVAAEANPVLADAGEHLTAIHDTVAALDRGALRVAEKIDDRWVVNEWVKSAILLYFRVARMQVTEIGPFEYYDKIPLKRGFRQQGVRVVPPATARFGSHLERGAILMPSYVNIGARVGAGTMVDTWATVGSCAQVGAGVHLSGGVGLGGVLEPPSAQPVIIEDGAFVGSRCIVVEGVRVEQEAVLGANVVLTASTPVIDVTGEQEQVFKGRVPARAVVIPGTRPKAFTSGTYNVPCALIIGRRKPATDRKTSLNETLRAFSVQA